MSYKEYLYYYLVECDGCFACACVRARDKKKHITSSFTFLQTRTQCMLHACSMQHAYTIHAPHSSSISPCLICHTSLMHTPHTMYTHKQAHAHTQLKENIIFTVFTLENITSQWFYFNEADSRVVLFLVQHSPGISSRL